MFSMTLSMNWINFIRNKLKKLEIETTQCALPPPATLEYSVRRLRLQKSMKRYWFNSQSGVAYHIDPSGRTSLCGAWRPPALDAPASYSEGCARTPSARSAPALLCCVAVATLFMRKLLCSAFSMLLNIIT